jgi:SAM-dependent methyltransferase
MSERPAYVLGSDDAEIARLDGQASSIAGATEALLRAAGIGGPMRVLDLGTGLGHVAFQVADLLDPSGSVLGVDQAERLLEIAERRRAAAGAENIGFLQADARAFSASEPFDAIVARLLLFHLPDREEVLRRQLDALRPGGTMVLVEFDIGAMRAEPEVPLVEAVRGWIEAAFRLAGADPRIGTQAGQLLRHTGLMTSRRSGSSPTSRRAIRSGRSCARASRARWRRRSWRRASRTRRSWDSRRCRSGSRSRSSPVTRSSCRPPSSARGAPGRRSILEDARRRGPGGGADR